jgi:hypothetical protein
LYRLSSTACLELIIPTSFDQKPFLFFVYHSSLYRRHKYGRCYSNDDDDTIVDVYFHLGPRPYLGLGFFFFFWSFDTGSLVVGSRRSHVHNPPPLKMDGYVQKSGEKKITNKKKNARRTVVDTKRHKEMRARLEREREEKRIYQTHQKKEKEKHREQWKKKCIDRFLVYSPYPAASDGHARAAALHNPRSTEGRARHSATLLFRPPPSRLVYSLYPYVDVVYAYVSKQWVLAVPPVLTSNRMDPLSSNGIVIAVASHARNRQIKKSTFYYYYHILLFHSIRFKPFREARLVPGCLLKSF